MLRNLKDEFLEIVNQSDQLRLRLFVSGHTNNLKDFLNEANPIAALFAEGKYPSALFAVTQFFFLTYNGLDGADYALIRNQYMTCLTEKINQNDINYTDFQIFEDNTDNCFVLFCEALANNVTLKKLHIFSAQISEMNCLALFEALKKNQTLEELHFLDFHALHHVYCDNVVQKKFLELLDSNYSLTFIKMKEPESSSTARFFSSMLTQPFYIEFYNAIQLILDRNIKKKIDDKQQFFDIVKLLAFSRPSDSCTSSLQYLPIEVISNVLSYTISLFKYPYAKQRFYFGAENLFAKWNSNDKQNQPLQIENNNNEVAERNNVITFKS